MDLRVGIAHPKIAVLVVQPEQAEAYTAAVRRRTYHTLTGWEGLSVEQALIAAPWSAGSLSALAGTSPSEANGLQGPR
jgi:hypothetical protein